MSEPQRVSAVISEYIARRGFARTGADAQLVGLWKRVAGEHVSEKTRVIGLRRGVLEIGVANSVLLNELVSFQRTQLLKELQAATDRDDIRDLRFRLRSQMNQPDNPSGGQG